MTALGFWVCGSTIKEDQRLAMYLLPEDGEVLPHINERGRIQGTWRLWDMKLF